jgi:hypothetical protein
MPHIREPRFLGRKMVEIFTLVAQKSRGLGTGGLGMTQELQALVLGFSHHLNIIIGIALKGALKLGREYGMSEALQSFLDKLAAQRSPSACRMMAGAKDGVLHSQRSAPINTSVFGVTYGFRSLSPEIAGVSPLLDVSQDLALSDVPVPNPPSDLCVACALTITEDCVRLGTYQRWHSNCIRCKTCGIDSATAATAKAKNTAVVTSGTGAGGSAAPVLTTARLPPANVDLFVWSPDSTQHTISHGDVPTTIYCTEHAYPDCRGGFQAVSRLEQYAFLLNVALRRLHLLLKKRKLITPTHTSTCCIFPTTVYHQSPLNRCRSHDLPLFRRDRPISR